MILEKSYKEKCVSKYADFGGFRDVFAPKLRVVANFEHPDLKTGKSFLRFDEGISILQTLKNSQTSNIEKFGPDLPPPHGASETYDRIQNFGAFAEKEHLPRFVYENIPEMEVGKIALPIMIAENRT